MFKKRKRSLVVEGVHLNTDQMMELVRRHPNCVPFMIYISNELEHRECFAVRARHMTIDPQENKYIKYFDNIRIIQRHLCKHADKYLIPKIANTNVDRNAWNNSAPSIYSSLQTPVHFTQPQSAISQRTTAVSVKPKLHAK